MPSCSLKPCQNWGGQYPGMGGQYHRNMHKQMKMNRMAFIIKPISMLVLRLILTSMALFVILNSCTNKKQTPEPVIQHEPVITNVDLITNDEKCKTFYEQYITIASSEIDHWEIYLMLADTGFFKNQASSEELYAYYFAIEVLNTYADLGMNISESTADLLTQYPNARKEFFRYLECLPNRAYLRASTLGSLIEYLCENCYDEGKFRTEFPWLVDPNNIQYFREEKERFLKEVPGYCD